MFTSMDYVYVYTCFIVHVINLVLKSALWISQLNMLEWLSSIVEYAFLNLLELYFTPFKEINFQHLKFNILHSKKKV